MKILKLCDKKKLNHNSKNVIEVDSTDLERLKGFTYSDEYLSIHNRDLEGKTIQQWFQVNDLSYWWFVDPIISPKFDQIALFIDRLEICIKKYNPEKKKEKCVNFIESTNSEACAAVKENILKTKKKIVKVKNSILDKSRIEDLAKQSGLIRR